MYHILTKYPRRSPGFVYASEMASASKLFCRICSTEVQPKHSTALFSDAGLQQGWPSRLRELLLVRVDSSDGLPMHICRSCVGKVETMERKLKALRQQARDTIESFPNAPHAGITATRKRPKSTSGELDVSPAIAKARPPAKRALNAVASRQLFPSTMTTSTDVEPSSK